MTHVKPLKGSNMTGCCEESFRKGLGEKGEELALGKMAGLVGSRGRQV